MSIGIPYPNSSTARENFCVAQVTVLEEDPLHDIALLKTMANPFAGDLPALMEGVSLELAVAHIERARPRDGAPTAICGFPLNQPVLITSAGVVASAWPLGHEMLTLPGHTPETNLPADAYLVAAAANAGNSGGPVFQPDGRLIGVCIGGLQARVGASSGAPVQIGQEVLTYSAGLAVVSPSVYVLALLEKHGVEILE